MVPLRMFAVLGQHLVKHSCSRGLFDAIYDRRMPFRQELDEVLGDRFLQLRKAYRLRRPGLPYEAPLVVRAWLPSVERWFRWKYARQMAGEADSESETSSS
jgi:hypothetical protein